MKFHYLSWRNHEPSVDEFSRLFLRKQSNVYVWPREISRIDRIYIGRCRDSTKVVPIGREASHGSLSIRVLDVSPPAESIPCFHHPLPSALFLPRPDARTGFEGNLSRGGRKFFPKRLLLFAGNLLISSRKTAILLCRSSRTTG